MEPFTPLLHLVTSSSPQSQSVKAIQVRLFISFFSNICNLCFPDKICDQVSDAIVSYP